MRRQSKPLSTPAPSSAAVGAGRRAPRLVGDDADFDESDFDDGDLTDIASPVAGRGTGPSWGRDRLRRAASVGKIHRGPRPSHEARMTDSTVLRSVSDGVL